MPNVLILCAHRAKRSPSQRYRFEQYLPFLETHGFKFTFSFLLNEKNDQIFYSQGNIFSKALILLKTFFIRLKDVKRFKNFDIIFIQREAQFLGTSYFEKKAFESGAKVIFDFDDSIWLPDTSPGNKKWAWLKNANKFFKNVTYAQTVIAGNNYLAERARRYNKNVIIIPTTIDTDFHFPKLQLREKEFITIGWSGSISTIKHFEMIVPTFVSLYEKYSERLRFKLMGAENYVHSNLKINCVKWAEETEVDVLNTFDIGIMPLPNDEWANGKCGLKGLSYMACGVATVMSNVGVNSQIIQHGENGFLCETEDDWLKTLSLLIENSELRNEMGKKGRVTVMEKYSVNAVKNLYLDAFTKF
jgi:glycosyltransferase involved in cell wall biosynthesis